MFPRHPVASLRNRALDRSRGALENRARILPTRWKAGRRAPSHPVMRLGLLPPGLCVVMGSHPPAAGSASRHARPATALTAYAQCSRVTSAGTGRGPARRALQGAIGPPSIGIERGAPRAVAMPERADSTATTPVRPSSAARGGRIVLMACAHHGDERTACRHAVTPGSRWGRLPRRRRKARIRESLASRWWGAGR
jgi:hypothetical protein